MATPKKSAGKNTKRVVLLDAHAILHRAYHALPDFTSQKGEPTGALYGYVTMILKIADELKPDYLIACYDLPEPTHRHVAFEAYKAQRKKTDDALVAQMIRSRDLCEAFSIPIYEKAGFEADDILGTIVEELKNDKDTEIVIASGDMDTLQLIDGKKVQVYTLKKGIKDTILYDEKGVEERFGFSPALIPDYKGLRGDPSDNIPGIAGIGEKSATELITNFGALDEMFKILSAYPERFEKAGIKKRIVELLREGEEDARFSKELATIRRDAPIGFALPEQDWRESVDTKKITTLFQELGFRSLISRVQTFFGGVVGEEAQEIVSEKQQQEKEVIDEQERKETQVALWLLDSEKSNPSDDDILEYAGTDSFKEARAKILRELEGSPVKKVFHDIEKPLIPIVDGMEAHGVLVDVAYLKTLSHEYHKHLEKIEKKIFDHAGQEFNINSPKQLGEILFNKLGLSVKGMKKTAGGAQSTRESELEKLKGLHPIIDEILEYREYQKLLSTYIDNIPLMVRDDGRLHTRFLQAGTTTGRMSSQNPNLQNLPTRTDAGRAIRQAVIAPKGFILAAFDYSQIELRVAAFLSGDEKLIDTFSKDGDIHRAVAAEVFNVPPEMVDSEMRRRAKIINFGILYGMGVNALRTNLGTDRKEAENFLEEYFRRFSGVREYVARIKRDVVHDGFTETLFGRRRYFHDIKSPLPHIRAQAERMAVNAPIQGTQADIIKIAMSRVDALLKEKKWEHDAHLILQVHDELVYEIKEDKKDHILLEIKGIMEHVLSLEETSGIPLKVEVKVGNNWGEMEQFVG